MTQYTGNIAQKRYAILAMNMQGGGGFEIWQYLDKTPDAPSIEIALGDTGIFAVKIRCKNIYSTYDFYIKENVNILNTPVINSRGKKHFFIKDPWNNIFELIEDEYWFTNENKLTGGVAGVVIGVNDMDKSIDFYKSVLGFSIETYSGENVFSDWQGLRGSDHKFKRVILIKNWKATGSFGKLLGPVHIELVQAINYQPKKIFENRHWGDLGFIHVCFDLNNMKAHEVICSSYNYPLTVNSANSFDMGEASGHFSYNEDPDRTLIEYVETHKVPVAKKFGLYLNIKNRSPKTCLPDWVVKCLRFSRVKKLIYLLF